MLRNGGPRSSGRPQVALIVTVFLAVGMWTPAGVASASTPAPLAGHAVAWGVGSSGQLGTGGVADSAVPVAVDASGALATKTLVQVSQGAGFSCALDSAGAVYCWGSDSRGDLGNGPLSDSLVPAPVDTSGVLAGKFITQIDLGNLNTACALDSDGHAYCWGSGDGSGMLGNGQSGDSEVPVAVDMTAVPGGAFKQISVGNVNACGVNMNSQVYCWGYGYAWGIGDGTQVDELRPSPVSTAGVLAGKALTQVSVGATTACVLDNAGAAFCWGNSGYPVLGSYAFPGGSPVPVAVDTTGVLAGRTLVQVSVGGFDVCALDSAGVGYCWGGTDGLGKIAVDPSPVPVAVDTSGVLAGKVLTSISTESASASCALDSTGAAYCWGAGYLGNGSGSTLPVAVDTSGILAGQPLTQISAGEDHVVALVGTAYSAGVPGAPTAVSGVPGNGQVQVSWSAPVSDGGSPVTGYTVLATPGGLSCQTIGDTTCTVVGLTNGTVYRFTVTASNSNGAGLPSTSSVAVTPVGPAGPPTSVTGQPLGGAIRVSWVAPASTGGSPITGYRTTASPSGLNCTTVAPTPTYCSVSGLTNGIGYTFTVQALSAFGYGVASAPSATITPFTVPGAPTAVVATAGNGSATVTWRAPASDGGSPIGRYMVESSRGFAPTDCPAGAILSCIVTDLANGVPITFTVRAVNLAGSGPYSLASNSVTPSAVPGAPTNVHSVSNGGIPAAVQAMVSWTPPQDDGGSPITSYTVTATPSGRTCTTSTTSCAVPGLTYATTYTFTVTATNANGAGPASAGSILATGLAYTALTLVRSASTITNGSAVTLSGRLTCCGTTTGVGGQSVQLLYLRHGTVGNFKVVGTVTTSSSGSWTITTKPPWSVDYFARYLGSPTYMSSISGPPLTVVERKKK